MAAELIEHPKEIAEHIMLVDLARNDVGRVVEFGSVTRRRDDDPRALQPRDAHDLAGVGRARATGKRAIDVLRATLPAGTVSGAPKVRAMEIIDELEPTKRGPYAGVVGYLDFSGNIDTAIAIRTLVVGDDGRASVQAGAGIVADSVAEHEDLECHNKARALLAAIPAARRMTARRRAHAGRTGDALWIAFRPWGMAVDLRTTEGAVPIERDVVRGRGPGGGRRTCRASSARTSRPWRRRVGAGRSCSSPPARSMPGCASPASADDELSLLDVDAGLGEAVLARLAALQAPHQGRARPRAVVGLGPPGPERRAARGRGARRARAAGRLARGRRRRPARRGGRAARPALDALPTPPRSRRCASSAACRRWAPSSPTPRSRPRPASGSSTRR